MPMVAEFDRTYTYEEAKAIVTEGLAPLGEEYGKILREGFENRWVDEMCIRDSCWTTTRTR